MKTSVYLFKKFHLGFLLLVTITSTTADCILCYSGNSEQIFFQTKLFLYKTFCTCISRWSAGSSHMGTIVFKLIFRSFAKDVWITFLGRQRTLPSYFTTAKSHIFWVT